MLNHQHRHLFSLTFFVNCWSLSSATLLLNCRKWQNKNFKLSQWICFFPLRAFLIEVNFQSPEKETWHNHVVNFLELYLDKFFLHPFFYYVFHCNLWNLKNLSLVLTIGPNIPPFVSFSQIKELFISFSQTKLLLPIYWVLLLHEVFFEFLFFFGYVKKVCGKKLVEKWW